MKKTIAWIVLYVAAFVGLFLFIPSDLGAERMMGLIWSGMAAGVAWTRLFLDRT